MMKKIGITAVAMLAAAFGNAMAQEKISVGGVETAIIGELPAVGAAAPDFLLTDVDLTEVGLRDFDGMYKVLSIVPSLDTATCALSAKIFNERVEERDDTVILNISMDLPFANKRFCELNDLQTIRALSAFRAPHFGLAYGVRIEEGPMRGLFARAIVLVDKENTVRHVELVYNVSDEPDYEAVFNAITQL